MIPHMTQDTPAQSVAADSKPTTGFPWLLAVGGIVLSLAGPVVYSLAIDMPWIRSSGAPAFALIIIGVTISFVAVNRRPRLATKIMACLNSAFLVLFGYMFYFMLAVPESPKFDGLKTAPDFSLKDENNSAVSLADARSSGPVLLVFYRGFW
jgi:hypothetical protein